MSSEDRSDKTHIVVLHEVPAYIVAYHTFAKKGIYNRAVLPPSGERGIVGFDITESERMTFPALKDAERVFLVFRRAQ